MIPSPSELKYFLEVSQTLNLSRAAERLGISQPTLSVAIQRLENSVGTDLFVRTKTGVRLTQSGHKLEAQVKHLMAEWEKIRADAIRNEEELHGRYTLGCHPSVALFALPRFLPQIIRDNPGFELKLVHDHSRKITEDVVSFRVDFGIVVNPVEHPDLVIRHLCDDEVTLWTGPGSAPEQDPFSGKGVLICDTDLLQTQSLIQQMARKGMVFKRTLTTSSLEVITSLVASCAGVGLLPGRVAGRDKALGLRPLRTDGPKFMDQICLVYRADAQKSKASRTILKIIERSLLE